MRGVPGLDRTKRVCCVAAREDAWVRHVYLVRALRVGGNSAVRDQSGCILHLRDGFAVPCARDSHLHAAVYAYQPLGRALNDDGARDRRLQEGGVGALSGAQQLCTEQT